MYTHIPYFQAELVSDLEKVDAVIRRQVKSDVVLINQVGEYIIGSGGKRLRPITTILAGKALGYADYQLYQQAAMVEFIHTSTLLHDDVVDESELRRGRKTANNIFGNATAVLVGDFLYTRAFQLMVSPDSMKIMKVMADATNIIAAGEVIQLINIGNTAITQLEYIDIIKSKTAKLFEAAAQVGAILAGANEQEELALKNYGMYMGTAFQIIDDILDYAGDVDEIGKQLGDDLAEGKATLPLIYLMQQENEDIANVVRQALENTDRNNFAQIHQYVVGSDALAYCYSVAEKISNNAIASIANLAENQYTDTLRQLATQSLKRIK